ncbi:hypothetical protein NQ317_000932 [Molorchus minor]|uniref:PH domain-containing protein n=1 Tax=Molorchus minor TaxID=1323400 RepID=A0ABQ9JZW4_9CUCU|nr:hypothetical protein NQ317_000932 [Molorchus minor]
MAEQNTVPTQTPTQFENPMFREIHKNTWLKTYNIYKLKKRKKEKFWVVFCVHDDTDAFLETYVDNKLSVFHKPEWYISLNNVQHISPTICAHDQEYEFVLTLATEVIRLAAPTWEQMLDWVESLRGKLHEMKILSPKENVYTKLPDRTTPLLPTRDPTSPLPPPPEMPPQILPGIEPLHTNETSRSESFNSSHTYSRRRSGSQTDGLVRRNSNTSEPRSAAPVNNVFTFENFNVSDTVSNTPPVSSATNTHYELLFQIQQTPGPSTRNIDRQLERTETTRLLERSASCSPRILQPPPQPYKTLREQQVLQLQKK